MSISTSCSSHVSFERSNHTWTKSIQIQNAVQPKKIKRIVGLTQVFWSVKIEQPLLLQADTGWDKWHCSWSLCVATAETAWHYLYSIWCPSPLPALHMFLLKDLIILEPNPSKFKTQCNLRKSKELSVSHKFSEASRLNSLCCCKLTRAEINGIAAGRCVWRPRSLHEIIFIPYDVHLHFLLFTCSFWKILSCLNQIQTHQYVLGSPWNAYALCLDDALEIGKGWVQAAVKGA